MPSAVTDLVRRWGSFDQRGGGDECQEGVDEVPDELVARKEEEENILYVHHSTKIVVLLTCML